MFPTTIPAAVTVMIPLSGMIALLIWNSARTSERVRTFSNPSGTTFL